jgi:CII-binding regulator of phage lambda lysogenization HflD
MAFEKGNKLSKGRPKGAVNRSTEMMKLTIARAVDNTLNTLSSDLEKIKKKDPERAIELALKLMEFTLPKLSRTEMKAEVEQRIQQIQVNINQTGSNELGDK